MEKLSNIDKQVSQNLKRIVKEKEDTLRLSKDKTFDYVEEGKICNECGGYKGGEMIEGYMCECGRMEEGDMYEDYSKGQKYIAKQAKPYNKIDAEDFRVLRSKKKKNMNEISDEFDYEMQEPCPHCNGTGYDEFDDVECEWCDGTGEYDEYGDLKISDDMPPYKTKYRMPRPGLSDLEESECVECGSMEEGETEEGNKFTYELELAREKGKKEFSVDGKKYPVKESYQFSENEMINFIERIVEEEKKFRAGKEPKGYREYDKAHRQDKKINDEYVESVVKKMKDYLKTGSKGKFSFDPKIFPAGNGELAEMEKMAYVPSDAVGEYIENFTAAALENIDYDTFEPDKDWVDDNIVGSSRTGNNPKWANAVETPTNKKRKEIKDKNLWRKTELKAYNKAPQPVYKETAGNSKDGSSNIMKALESEDRSNKKLTEEFNRMKNLIGYSSKTQ